MLKKTTKRSSKVSMLQERIEGVIRTKAYEIHKRDKCDDEIRNWLLAENELKGI